MNSIGTDRRNMKTYRPLFGKIVRDTEGRLWFYDHRWLCIGNMESDLSDIKIVKQLEEEQARQCGAAFELMIREDTLYITFMKRPELLVYNIANHTYEIYKNNVEDSLLSQQYSSVFYEESLIFMPVDISKPICVFDFNKHQYTIVYSGETYNGIIGIVYKFQSGRKWLLPVYNTNKIFVMKPDKLKGKFMYLDNDISVNAIYGTEEDLWICQNDKKVIVNLKGGKAAYIPLTNDNKELGDPFSGLVKYEDKVIVLPRFDKHIYVIELKNEVIEEISVPYDKEEFEKRVCSLTYGYHIYNDILYLFPWGLDEIIELRLSDYRMTKRELQIKKDDYCEFIYQPPKKEMEDDDLQNYIGWIAKH